MKWGDTMGKYSKNPKYDIISVRVTEDEKKAIQSLAWNSKVNVTNLIRELIFSSGPLAKSPNQ